MAEPDQLYAALAYVTRLWRLSAGMSQAQAYEAAGLKKNVYIRLENNDGVYTAAQIDAIAAIHRRQGWQLMREAYLLLEHGELPELPPSVREWRRRFG